MISSEGQHGTLAKRSIISPAAASLVLFLEGFVSVSIQMIMLRQLVPFVGYSINVTSIVITFFLAALAFGYRAGGRVQRNHLKRIRLNLFTSGILAGVGLSYICLDAFLRLSSDVTNNHLVGVAFVSVIILMPLVYLLAQTVVLLIKFRESGDAAQQAGDTFHISTIGNVIGGLVTTLVVMYFFGVGIAIALNAAILGAAYIIVSPGNRPVSVCLAVMLVALGLIVNVGFERNAFDRTTAYANYYTYTSPTDSSRHLIVNGQDASRTDVNGVGHPYIEHFETEIFEGGDRNDNVLVLGAGGFTLGQGRTHSSKITFVDVDEQLRELATVFHGRPDGIQGRFVAEDARAFLLQQSTPYDHIVLDTFSHQTSVPVHLLTLEFFELVRGSLTEHGMVHMNYIASSEKDSQFRRGIDNTVRAVFGSCSVQRIDAPGTQLYNMLYTCRKSQTDTYRVIYRDENTKASVDSGFE